MDVLATICCIRGAIPGPIEARRRCSTVSSSARVTSGERSPAPLKPAAPSLPHSAEGVTSGERSPAPLKSVGDDAPCPTLLGSLPSVPCFPTRFPERTAAINPTSRSRQHVRTCAAIPEHSQMKAAHFTLERQQENFFQNLWGIWWGRFAPQRKSPHDFSQGLDFFWRPQGDLNPCRRRESRFTCAYRHYISMSYSTLRDIKCHQKPLCL